MGKMNSTDPVVTRQLDLSYKVFQEEEWWLQWPLHMHHSVPLSKRNICRTYSSSSVTE